MAHPPIRLEHPAEVAAAVPYLLGYHPHDTLVVLGLRQHQVAVIAAADLPDLNRDHAVHTASARRLATRLTACGATRAVLIGYGDATLVATTTAATGAALRDGGVETMAALRIQDQHWWDLACTDPGSCPPAGHAFDASTTVAAAAATAAGRVALPDKAAVAAQLQPAHPTQRAEFVAATAIADAHVRHLPGALGADSDTTGVVADMVRRLVSDTQLEHRTGQSIGMARRALITVMLTLPDALEASVQEAGGHTLDVQLWISIVTTAPEHLITGPAVMLAFTALLAGDGVLADAALDRAGDHYLVTLARQLLYGGIDPLSLNTLLGD